MTDSNSASAIPGWYPTAPGSLQVRWWDGTQWTDYYQNLGGVTAYLDTAPAGTNPGTVWIWLFVLLPLVQLAELPFLAGLYSSMFSGLSDPRTYSTVPVLLGPDYFAVTGVNLLVYALLVLFAALDYRALKARGVPRPFHWAWTFLYSIIYIIGRSVVVNRRTGSGMAPLWIYIIINVGTIIAFSAVLIPIMNSIVNSAVLSAT